MMKLRFFVILCSAVLFLTLSGCDVTAVSPAGNPSASSVPAASGAPAADAGPSSGMASSEEASTMKMNVNINGHDFTATLEQNAAVDALVEMMRGSAVTLQMSDYSGFEKVGSLGTSLPASNQQTTTQAGDIVLYNSSQIVIFYGSNSWSYTRLGHIDDLSGWTEALGDGSVSVTFTLQ